LLQRHEKQNSYLENCDERIEPRDKSNGGSCCIDNRIIQIFSPGNQRIAVGVIGGIHIGVEQGSDQSIRKESPVKQKTIQNTS